MEHIERKIGVVTTLGKKYQGMLDVPDKNLRTSDMLNSSSVYWKDSNERCLDNAIQLNNVSLLLDDSLYKKFTRVQIKLSEIIFFYDDQENVGNEMEKKRAQAVQERTGEVQQVVNIITPLIANSFYDISGTFYGHFKKKSRDRFVSLVDVSIVEIGKMQDKWVKKDMKLPYRYAGVNTQFIESLAIES